MWFTILKVILLLWLLSNIGCIPHVVQFVIVVYFILNSLHLLIPSPILITTSLSSVSVRLLFSCCYIH